MINEVETRSRLRQRHLLRTKRRRWRPYRALKVAVGLLVQPSNGIARGMGFEWFPKPRCARGAPAGWSTAASGSLNLGGAQRNSNTE